MSRLFLRDARRSPRLHVTEISPWLQRCICALHLKRHMGCVELAQDKYRTLTTLFGSVSPQSVSHLHTCDDLSRSCSACPVDSRAQAKSDAARTAPSRARATQATMLAAYARKGLEPSCTRQPLEAFCSCCALMRAFSLPATPHSSHKKTSHPAARPRVQPLARPTRPPLRS